MGWVADLLNAFKGDAAGNFKAITSELKELKENYRKDLLEQKQINAEQIRINEGLKLLMIELAEMEERCLHDQRILKEQYTNILERLIFITKGRHREDDF